MSTEAKGAALRRRLLAALKARPGELQTTRDLLRQAGIDVNDPKAYDRGCAALSRLERAGSIERVSKGVYRVSGTLTPKEMRARLEREPPLFHDVGVRAEGDFSSVQQARDSFAKHGGALAHVPPTATGPSGGNKTLWHVPFGERRTLTVAAHKNGLDATFGVTDRPLDASALVCFADFLHFLTGLPPSRWQVYKYGINKDLQDVHLAGVSEVRFTLDVFASEVLRFYEHEHRGLRCEVHSHGVVSLPVILAFLQGGPFAQEARLARIETAYVSAAATLQEVRRLQNESIGPLNREGGRALKRRVTK